MWSPEARTLSLKKDEIIFHKPNEFHTVRSNGKVAPNVVVVSFECTSPAMDFFRDRVFYNRRIGAQPYRPDHYGGPAAVFLRPG